MPLEKMARWLEKESAGFGEGKTYDTMAEEQLLEEMEQSREAQLAKIINLKNQFKSAAIARSKMQESHHRGGIEPLVFFFFFGFDSNPIGCLFINHRSFHQAVNSVAIIPT